MSILLKLFTACAVTLGVGVATIAPSANATCTRYCNPAVSKPCGKACISKYFACHKPTTTACSGTNPNSTGKPIYKNPKHVEPADYDKPVKPEATETDGAQ